MTWENILAPLIVALVGLAVAYVQELRRRILEKISKTMIAGIEKYSEDDADPLTVKEVIAAEAVKTGIEDALHKLVQKETE